MGDRRAHSLMRAADTVKLLLSLMLACALMGCERRSSNTSSGSGSSTTATTVEASSSSVDRVTVFATVYPLADVARQIGGRWINLDWAVERGQTLESFTPPEDLRARLNSAQLVITGGGANESWAIQGVGDNSMRAGRALRMTARGADDAQPAATTDDDSSTVTGQLWLDPIAVRDFAAAIAQRLVTLRPRGQDEFRRNAGDFQRQVNAIVVDYQSRLGGIARRRVLVLSADFNPLLARYGAEPVQPIDQPSPLRLTGDDVAALRNTARAQHLATMLLQADTPRAVADDLASRVGVQVLTLDSFGSSAAATGASTYQDLLRSNLDQLAKIK